MFDRYVNRFALQEPSLTFDTADELADMTEDVSCPSVPYRVPHLNESTSVLLADGNDPAEEFTPSASTSSSPPSNP